MTLKIAYIRFATPVSEKFALLIAFSRTHPGLFWILVFTLLSRVVVYLIGQPWNQDVVNQILDGDAVVYDRIARSFLAGVWFSDMAWAADRTFGYPFFVTAIYAISNNGIWVVLAVQTLLNALMVPMVYWISKTLFRSQQSGTIAAGLFALSAIPLAWAARMLFTETLFAFLVLLFLMLYLRIWQSESFRLFLLLGVLLGIATIVRSVLQFFIVIPVLIILLQDRLIRTKITLIFGIVIGLLVIIAPFQLINYSNYGHYSISAISGNVLFKSIAQAKADADGTTFYEARDSLGWQDWEETYPKDVTYMIDGVAAGTHRENPFDHSAISKHHSIDYVLERPQEFLILHALGMVSFLIGTEKSAYLYVIANQERPDLDHPLNYESFSERIIRNLKDVQKEYFLTPVLLVKLLVEYVFIAGGFLILVRRQQKMMVLFLVLAIAYFIVVTGFMGRAPRYKIPILSIYAFIGGGGAMLIWAYWREFLSRILVVITSRNLLSVRRRN